MWKAKGKTKNSFFFLFHQFDLCDVYTWLWYSSKKCFLLLYLVLFSILNIFLAICQIPCKNNGKCVKPEQCTCTVGYTGKHCELDINECVTDKPCDQMCYNTDGSFYCTCRLGFILHSDRQSCKKIDSSFGSDNTDIAFEAKDLENDVDNDNLSTRINNIEKVGATSKTFTCDCFCIYYSLFSNWFICFQFIFRFVFPLFLDSCVFRTAFDNRKRTQHWSK